MLRATTNQKCMGIKGGANTVCPNGSRKGDLMLYLYNPSSTGCEILLRRGKDFTVELVKTLTSVQFYINGKPFCSPQTLEDSDTYFFKAGNYNQAESTSYPPSIVKIKDIEIEPSCSPGNDGCEVTGSNDVTITGSNK